jgi:hypothetical protein
LLGTFDWSKKKETLSEHNDSSLTAGIDGEPWEGRGLSPVGGGGGVLHWSAC